MKIVVAGGRNEADFLIGMLKIGKHKLIVINEDRSYCEHLSTCLLYTSHPRTGEW